MVTKRFQVYLVNLAPTIGREIKKTRPCLIISPDEMNRHISTVIVAPMTTKGRDYPTHVPCRFQKKMAWIVLNQITTIDKSRLIKKLGEIDSKTQVKVLSVLQKMFTL